MPLPPSQSITRLLNHPPLCGLADRVFLFLSGRGVCPAGSPGLSERPGSSRSRGEHRASGCGLELLCRGAITLPTACWGQKILETCDVKAWKKQQKPYWLGEKILLDKAPQTKLSKTLARTRAAQGAGGRWRPWSSHSSH